MPGRIFWIIKEILSRAKKLVKLKKQRSEFGENKVAGSCRAEKETRKEGGRGRGGERWGRGDGGSG